MRIVLLLLFTTVFLVGCGDTLGDIKEAAAGINSRANEAASAISIEVHTVRNTELQHSDQTFTINDLFKTTLRDVQWDYDEKESTLSVSGTLLDNGLFANESIAAIEEKKLLEHGKVKVNLFFTNGTLNADRTTVTMTYLDEQLVELNGENALHPFYKVYAAK